MFTASKGCTFGECEQQVIYHAAFLPSEPAVITGGPDGKICAWYTILHFKR